MDGGYHLNLTNINDFNTLILWVFIMVCDIKFIPTLLDSHLCTPNIFSIEFLQRKAHNINLITMSIWNKELRDIIIKNIGTTLYTTLLNEKINITTNNQHNEISIIDMSIFSNTLYDMLRDNVIDFDVISYPENNTITHMLFESINPYMKKIRQTNNIFIALSHYKEQKLEYLPENIKIKITTDKYKQNDKHITPITGLLYGYDCYGAYDNEYKIILYEYLNIYELDDIKYITLNKEKPNELFLMLQKKYIDGKLMNQFNNLSDDIILCYYNYFMDYAWIYLNHKNNDIKNMMNDICIELSNKYELLKIFTNTNYEITNTNITNINQLIFSINIIKNKNLLEKCDENIIKEYINFVKINKMNFLQVIPKILTQLESIFFKFDTLIYDIFNIYLDLQMDTKFSGIYNEYLNRLYEIDINKNKTSNVIINNLNTHKMIDHINISNTVSKYIDYIAENLIIDTFMNIFVRYTNLRDLLFRCDKIKNTIKCGNSYDDTEQIFTLLEMFDENYDYVLNDISEYKKENTHRLIECLTNITTKEDFVNFCHIFDIDDEFIIDNNVKSIYINNILSQSENYDNLTYFLEMFKFNKSDVTTEQIIQLINKNTDSAIYIICYFGYSGILSEEDVIKLISNKILIPTYITHHDFYSNLILNYNNDKIIHKCIIEIFKNELSYDDITTIINKNNIITEYILDISIHNINSVYLIKYYNNKDKKITSHLVSSYNKTFLETNKLSIDDKINILINIYGLIEDRIGFILINDIKKDKNNISEDNISNFAKLCNLYNQTISDDIIEKYPELVYYTKNKQIIEKILDEAINSYDLFLKIINTEEKSSIIEKKLLKLTKQKDILLYIECLIKFNSKLTKNDKQIILENLINDKNIFKMILDNEYIKTQLFDTEKELIYTMNNNSDFILSELDSQTIIKYIHNYKLYDLLVKNKVNIPRIFAFLTDITIIEKFMEMYDIKTFKNITDRTGHNIYDYMILNGKIDNVPNVYLLDEKYIINTIKIMTTDNLIKLFENLDKQQFNKLCNTKDTDGNNLIYYIIRYHEKLFKLYVKEEKINTTMFQTNYNNDTLLMKLIKDSHNHDVEPIIKWIVNNFQLTTYDYYSQNKSGSVITYCMKYNNNLIKIFEKENIIKSLLNIYDTCDFICPYSNNICEKNIKMNVLYIACITNHRILDILLRTDKRITTKLIKEKLYTANFEHNILSIALFNNPESVQVLLGFINNIKYLEETDNLIGGFEKIIDVQPASWYYLQQYCNTHKYKLKLDLDTHWYGYNYKQKMTQDKIKVTTHYILDKQEIGNKNNTCNICDTYKHKVIFTKCRHKVCIVCALRSDKCGNCRIKINDDDKILL